MAAETVVDTNTGGDGQTTNDLSKAPQQNTNDRQDSTTEQNRIPPNPDGKKSGDDSDRRFRGLTADLQTERRQRQQYERDLAAAKAELEHERQRIQALVGVSPKNKEEQDADAVRQAFAKYFPHLAELTAEEIAELRETKELAKSQSETSSHYWTQHAIQMRDGVVAEIEKVYKTLSPRQKDQVTKAYVLRAQTDPEFLKRHEAGDRTLIQEFAKEWTDDWFEPARRNIASQDRERFRPVPSGKDRNLVDTDGGKKIDVNDPKAVEDLLVQGFRERGGQFRRGR